MRDNRRQMKHVTDRYAMPCLYSADILSELRVQSQCSFLLQHVLKQTDITSFLALETILSLQSDDCLFNYLYVCRDSSVGIATGYRLDDREVGVRVPVGSRIFFSPRRPDRLWGPPSLLSNGYRRLFLRG
jgi:hypothetical protein